LKCDELAARDIGIIVVQFIGLQFGTLDLTSAAGKMMLTMLAAVAELERDLLVDVPDPAWPGNTLSRAPISSA
jgi:DNA invertase Pin-like site-specific DNA recombinase